MSQSQNDGHRHMSSFSANKGYTCSSPFALEPSVIDFASEGDFEDSWQNAEKLPQTDFKVSLKDDKTNDQEESKIRLCFEDIRQNNSLGLKTNLSDGSLCENFVKNELSCPEDGEVIEADEANADLEEGEIQETPNEKSDTYNCRYYQMGFCLYGKDCRFLHVSDKGLYNMIDLSVSVQNNVHYPSKFVLKQKDMSLPPVSEVGETPWDRALKEALDRVDSRKKVTLDRENLRMTIQSVDFTDKKLTFKESKNSFSQVYVRKTRGSSRNRRKPAYKITCDKPEPSAKERIDMRCTYKRSKTSRDLRWSLKSVSCSSQSRSWSRSSCKRLSSSCSYTESPKRGRRILSSRISGSYRKRNLSTSSKSSSTDCDSKTVSRHFRRRKRESKSKYKSTKTSHCHRPVKILFPRKLEIENCWLSRRDIPRRAIPSKSEVTIKSTSYTRSCDKSCSDMSISPLSNLSNGKKDHLDHALSWSSDRHVRDMSISPLSDVSSPSRFLDQVEGRDRNVSNSKIENFGNNISGHTIHKSDPQNISGQIPLYNSRNVSKHTFEKKGKDSSQVMDLIKYCQNFKSDNSVEEGKNKSKTHVRTTASEFVVKHTNHTEVNKVKQKTNITQTNQSKKEILLKRLQEINAAIERKKNHLTL